METTQGSERELGLAFIEAVERRDFDRLEALLAPDVRFRALTPRREPVASTAAAARAIVEGWFGDSDPIEEVSTTVEAVADRIHVSYRLRLFGEGSWKLVEQQLFATARDGRLADISLVCSGFRPLGQSGRLEPDARLDALGEDCATLTPRIAAAVRDLRDGGVLEIVADDPAAEDGLRAWTRLTGNELVTVGPAASAEARTFLVRRH